MAIPEARKLYALPSLRLRHMAIATSEARKGFSRTRVWRSPHGILRDSTAYSPALHLTVAHRLCDDG